MRTYDFWRVDVFAARPLEGNPLAVFPRAQGLSDGEMLALAREMKPGETAVVGPPPARAAAPGRARGPRRDDPSPAAGRQANRPRARARSGPRNPASGHRCDEA